MSVTDELLQNADTYAENFDKGDLPLPPGRKVAVVACMDARLNPYGLLGLEEGDAHVIRNAGGVITDDEIRSLAISQRLLGTEEIILIHHTDCGMLTFTDDEFRRSVQDDTGIKPHWAAEAFGDLDEDVRQSIAAHPGQPVHPAQGQRARLRLRGRDGQAARGRRRLVDAAQRPGLRVEHEALDVLAPGKLRARPQPARPWRSVVSTSSNAPSRQVGSTPSAASASANSSSEAPCRPQPSCITTTISSVSSRRCEALSERIASSVTRPPALRMMCASPR